MLFVNDFVFHDVLGVAVDVRRRWSKHNAVIIANVDTWIAFEAVSVPDHICVVFDIDVETFEGLDREAIGQLRKVCCDFFIAFLGVAINHCDSRDLTCHDCERFMLRLDEMSAEIFTSDLSLGSARQTDWLLIQNLLLGVVNRIDAWK